MDGRTAEGGGGGVKAARDSCWAMGRAQTTLSQKTLSGAKTRVDEERRADTLTGVGAETITGCNERRGSEMPAELIARQAESPVVPNPTPTSSPCLVPAERVLVFPGRLLDFWS